MCDIPRFVTVCARVTLLFSAWPYPVFLLITTLWYADYGQRVIWLKFTILIRFVADLGPKFMIFIPTLRWPLRKLWGRCLTQRFFCNGIRGLLGCVPLEPILLCTSLSKTHRDRLTIFRGSKFSDLNITFDCLTWTRIMVNSHDLIGDFSAEVLYRIQERLPLWQGYYKVRTFAFEGLTI